jgi:polyisoprenoid-binding protein YceI
VKIIFASSKIQKTFMKKIKFLFYALAILFFTGSVHAQPKWVFDKAHSNLNFAIERLMVSDVTGGFRIKEATLDATGEDFDNASAYLVADVSSIDTYVPDRDHDLQKPGFFETEKYPDAVFRSTSFKKTGDKKYTVAGDLTLHGVTKPATFEITANMGFDDHSKKTVAGMKVVGVIKRSDFGIATTTPSKMLSDEVTITANLVFVKN